MTVRAALIDIDGTLCAGERLIPGGAEAILALRDLTIAVRLTTNIDSRPPQAVFEQLRTLGLDVRASEVFTPVVAALRLLGRPSCSVYPLVSAAVLPLFEPFDAGAPYSHVLVGDCRDRLSYVRLDEAFRAVRAGAELIALQRGRYFKRDDGDHVDAGALVAGLEYSTGVQARLLGKPHPDFFKLALDGTGIAASETIVVGDDLSSDVAGGHGVGATTVLVRTGKYADNAGRAADARADHVIDSIAGLPVLLAQLGRFDDHQPEPL
ncbi:MAG: TIGR01458 family HAD-type hydrolase [Candidatus Dormibacteraeota bacterium]|nr:TIGR01458 family HAD-type hydrolase [Candidatus Dormibacteraeota bacterium]MBV9526543.1 TIGR01458 family HAD-type hydrolase [Candidatus Dormibacteraeota bacterium]